MLYDPLRVGPITLENRLVMPPMQSDRASRGHVSDELIEYYRERSRFSRPGLIILEHCCICEEGRADAGQLSLAEDSLIDEHRRLSDAIHEAGSRVLAQLNHAGSAAEPFAACERVSASAVNNPRKKLSGSPRPLEAEEIRALQGRFAEAALRAVRAGYDGVEIHCAHGYLLNQFYSPLTNLRRDAYGAGSVEDRCRFLLETLAAVRSAVGAECAVSVRLGGADYLPGGSTEEDAAEACRLLREAGADLLDISGGMCGYLRPGHAEAGYFASMTKKIRPAVSPLPVLLTGGVRSAAEAERLLEEGAADLIGVGRALFRDAHWGEKQQAAAAD